MPIAGQNSGRLQTIRMDFTCRRYDTFSETFTITYRDSSNILQEVDLTNAFAQMWVKKKKLDTTPTLVMDVNLSGNEITISKPSTLMSLAAGRYWHDIEIKDADGNHITWIEGRFLVVEHVTEYVSEQLFEFYSYITNIFNFLDVPKRYIHSLFESIVTVYPSIAWILYPFKIVYSTVLTLTEQLKYSFKLIFSNVTVINDCKKIKYSIGWSMVLSDLTTTGYKTNSLFVGGIRIYGQWSTEGIWGLQYSNLDDVENISYF